MLGDLVERCDRLAQAGRELSDRSLAFEFGETRRCLHQALVAFGSTVEGASAYRRHGCVEVTPGAEGVCKGGGAVCQLNGPDERVLTPTERAKRGRAVARRPRRLGPLPAGRTSGRGQPAPRRAGSGCCCEVWGMASSVPARGSWGRRSSTSPHPGGSSVAECRVQSDGSLTALSPSPTSGSGETRWAAAPRTWGRTATR